MDIRRDVETCRLESLHEKGDEDKREDSETGPSHTGKPEWGQEMEGGGCWDGCGGATRRGPTKCEGGVAEYEGVV